jgi:fimbrial chaperone protein
MRTPQSPATLSVGLFIALIVLAAPLSAGTFNIAPIRSELTTSHRTDVLTLTNGDAQPVVVQVHVYAWSQIDGAERLEETRELLVTPPVLQIAGAGEQIVRTALRREADPRLELSYRVVFEEVPQAAPKDFSGLRIALHLSIPVFVSPTQGSATAQVHWHAKWLADGNLEISATNDGTGHLQVIGLEAQIEGDQPALQGLGAKYVLAGSRMSWRLKAPAKINREAAMVLRGHSDRGDFSVDIPAHQSE